MTPLDPETADRMARRAEMLEEGITVAVLASRPTGRSITGLIVAHERSQRRLALISVAANVLSIATILFASTRGTDFVELAAVAAFFVTVALAASIAAALSGRTFERKVHQLTSGRPPRAVRA